MPREKAEHVEHIVAKLREVEVELGWGKTGSSVLSMVREIIGTDDTTVTLRIPEELPSLDQFDPKSVCTCKVIATAHADARKSITARMWA